MHYSHDHASSISVQLEVNSAIESKASWNYTRVASTSAFRTDRIGR